MKIPGLPAYRFPWPRVTDRESQTESDFAASAVEAPQSLLCEVLCNPIENERTFLLSGVGDDFALDP